MGADDKLKVYITGATTAPGLALMRGLVARDHFVAGNAATLAEAKRLRATGGLPVYIDEHSAGDLAAALRMTGATLIVHAAPQAANSLLPGARQEAAALAGIEQGTEAVLQAAAQIDDACLVCCSFAALYGDTRGEAVGEDAEPAASGALLEAAAEMENAALESSVPACVLRAGLLYGPESASLAALRATLLDGGGLPGGVGEGLASWLHHEDLALAAALAAEQRPAGAIFNVADGRPATRGDFLRHFAGRMGLPLPQPGRMNAILDRLPRFGGDAGPAALSFAVNSDAIRERLGWAPAYPDLESGLEQTLLTWRAAAARA